MNFDNLSTIQLRQLVREKGLARGVAVSVASKADCIALLTGTRAPDSMHAPQLPGMAAGAAPAAAAAQGDDLAATIARAIAGHVRPTLDKDTVADLIDAALADLLNGDALADAVKKHAPAAGHTIHLPELPEPIQLEGEAIHAQFTQVLAWVRADVPVWLWGAPGSGKTHLAKQIAKALDVPAFVASIDETTTANKLLGFQNLVSGDFVEGWLYKPYREGGLVCLDEIDTGNPGILAALNALISNGCYMFPNGETVEKHARFRVIACANTKGTGATAGFTARNRLDAATLNRFALVEFCYDAGLEMSLCCGIPSDSAQWEASDPADAGQCQKWVRWIQDARAKFGQSVLISPRASILGVRALRAGIPAAEVAHALVYSLCSADTVSAIKDRAGDPAALLRKERAA
jgi:cobaltochelatase CobS